MNDEWQNCYGESWKGLICDEAFAHPAKYSRALIRRIYEHVIEEGWARPGATVVDPFGGVGLGGFDAMQHGFHFIGVELEEKFVGLGNQNIELWNKRFSRMPNWGTAQLIQGDSRKLSAILDKAGVSVSSPPFLTARQDTEISKPTAKGGPAAERISTVADGTRYGQTQGQLGAMKEGNLECAIASPLYSDSINARDHGIDWTKVDPKQTGNRKRGEDVPHGRRLRSQLAYTEDPDPANLGAMKEGSLAISSPPYPQPYAGGGGINKKGYGDGSDKVGSRTYQGRGSDRAEGNLETLNASGFDAAISSPPFESSTQVNNTPGDMTAGRARWEGGSDSAARVKQDYADYSSDNIGNQRGETFWSASRVILEQLYSVLAPGGHAVFVVKSFVRNKQIVDFPGQWAQLCEAVGFRLVHHHHAMLTEHYGTQTGFETDKEIKIKRASFFRRLHEAKNPETAINSESVLCFVKEGVI